MSRRASTASFIVAALLPGHVILQQPNQAAQALIHTQPAARHGLKVMPSVNTGDGTNGLGGGDRGAGMAEEATVSAIWRRAYPGEHHFGASITSSRASLRRRKVIGNLLSGEGRFFFPEWVWEVPVPRPAPHPIVLRGGQEHACDALVSEVPVRYSVHIGYCAEALIDPKTFNITCRPMRFGQRPPRPPSQLRVAIFPQTPAFSHLYAHYMLDAAAMLGLAAPLALAGYSLRWVHTGLLNHTRTGLKPPSWLPLDNHEFLDASRPLRNFALAVALAVPTPTDDAKFVLKGFEAPPGTRQPELQREWLPLSAYAIPFARGCHFAQSEPRGPRRWRCPAGGVQGKSRGGRANLGIVGLIARSGARKLQNEASVVQALMPVLSARGLKLEILNESLHRPAVFARLRAVIGVHGTAFGNVHACAPGTTVIEITGALMPRTWANFAVALGMSYFAYIAPRYPRSLWSFHSFDPRSDVVVHPANFSNFVAEAIDAAKPSLGRGSSRTCRGVPVRRREAGGGDRRRGSRSQGGAGWRL